jgi:arginase
LAVRIVRQPKKIVLIGAPTSAAAHGPGQERAPAALRAAGLVARLEATGFEVSDAGDIETRLFQPDEESPRARNIGAVVAALEALKPRVEQAVKSGALPLILGGDCTIALATLAGVRRYYRGASLLYFDRDADLNVPATSPSGCLDGMVVAHIAGRGAPELVRFWGEPPLVREPEIGLFGLERLDPPEQAWLERSAIRRFTSSEIQRRGPAAAARAALERIHSAANQVVLHFDVDVISSEDFAASDIPGAGGLRLAEVHEALAVFAQAENLAAIEVTEYNPERDPDGSAAQLLVELLATALGGRLVALAPAAEAGPAADAEAPASPESTEAAAVPAEAPAPPPEAAEAPATEAVTPAPAPAASEAAAAETPAPETPVAAGAGEPGAVESVEEPAPETPGETPEEKP